MPAAGLALAFALSCGSDSSPTSGPNGDAPPDTSTLSFQMLDVIGWSADGNVRTGLEMRWRLTFQSSTGRDCRINRYQLADSGQQVLYAEDDPIPAIVASGETLADKNPFIEVEGATPAGTYHFSVFYETGRRMVADDHTVSWLGPLSSGRLDTTFSVN